MQRAMLALLVLSLGVLRGQSYKDWYFGVDKIPDFRMMAVKPAASITDSVLYTCSAAVNESRVIIRFLINFRNLSEFCGTAVSQCRSPPMEQRRTNVVKGSLIIYESQLEFWSTAPMSGTVSCVFFASSAGDESLAQLYGFFRVFPYLPPPAEDGGLRDSLCNVQQGCRWEEKHCEALNHEHCPPCQEGMGFDPFYHLCYDPRQINQSCVFSHQCRQSDPRSVCVERRCVCRKRHVVTPDGCRPTVELGYLCGPGTVCLGSLQCKRHACLCQEDYIAKNGTCTPAASIDVKDMLVIATSTMIVFTAFTSMLCLLLRDKQGDEDETRSERSKYSITSIR